MQEQHLFYQIINNRTMGTLQLYNPTNLSNNKFTDTAIYLHNV